jgi:hypothetical protein
LNDELFEWRSGIKHDCARVMELRHDGSGFRNGLGECVDIEDEILFPMLKGSELTVDRVSQPKRWMIVPQRRVGDETSTLRTTAPKAWQYLLDHASALDRRASSIYRNRPRFSIFGIGDYSFAPWKVAISGFAKTLEFVVVGCAEGKPIVLDDTACFVGCQIEDEARTIAVLLNSTPAREFYGSLVFWDTKRPITIEVLRRLDIEALGRAEVEFQRCVGPACA